MPKFCGNCGTRNDDENAIRCSHCGAFFKNTIRSPYENNNDFGESNNSNNNLNNKTIYANDYSNSNNVSYSNDYQSSNNSYSNNSFGDNNGYGNYSGYSNNIYNNPPQRNQLPDTPVYQNITPRRSGSTAKKIVKIIVPLLLIAIIACGGIFYAYEYTGYRGTVHNFDDYFKHYEYTKIVDMYSLATFSEADDADNYKELDDDAQQKLDEVYDFFDEEVGHDYKLKFETVDDYRMSDDEYFDFLDSLDYPDKDDVIKDARVAEVKITATENSKQKSKNIKLILTKEEDKWKIYSFDIVE